MSPYFEPVCPLRRGENCAWTRHFDTAATSRRYLSRGETNEFIRLNRRILVSRCGGVGKATTKWRWMQSRANCSPRLIPDIREKYREFSWFRPICSSLKSLYHTVFRTFIAFSCQCSPLKNREFLIVYQGNAFPDTGIGTRYTQAGNPVVLVLAWDSNLGDRRMWWTIHDPPSLISVSCPSYRRLSIVGRSRRWTSRFMGCHRLRLYFCLQAEGMPSNRLRSLSLESLKPRNRVAHPE